MATTRRSPASARDVRAVDADTRRLVHALLPALGIPATRLTYWSLLWARCFWYEADLLLAMQPEQITTDWIRARVRLDGALPPDGAILIAPHHAAGRYGRLFLASEGVRLGGITGEPQDAAHRVQSDPTFQHLWRLGHTLDDRTYVSGVFHRWEAGQKGLRLLREGGYLSIVADDFTLGGTSHLLLGREWWLPRGPVWFAQQSGKPIVPCMVIPERRGWRLWIGEPVAPTPEAVIAALEVCICHAPESWNRTLALAWLRHREGERS
ncbi:MAG: hypothetical protein M3Y58_03015 [Chloroflexota bacterium]|nr:hypothetical protein [Chloroflexota bacterium]